MPHGSPGSGLAGAGSGWCRGHRAGAGRRVAGSSEFGGAARSEPGPTSSTSATPSTSASGPAAPRSPTPRNCPQNPQKCLGGGLLRIVRTLSKGRSSGWPGWSSLELPAGGRQASRCSAVSLRDLSGGRHRPHRPHRPLRPPDAAVNGTGAAVLAHRDPRGSAGRSLLAAPLARWTGRGGAQRSGPRSARR